MQWGLQVAVMHPLPTHGLCALPHCCLRGCKAGYHFYCFNARVFKAHLLLPEMTSSGPFLRDGTDESKNVARPRTASPAQAGYLICSLGRLVPATIDLGSPLPILLSIHMLFKLKVTPQLWCLAGVISPTVLFLGQSLRPRRAESRG